MKFAKYHALGNDYLILQESLSTHTEIDMPQPELIRWICNRHHGVGADGILIAVTSLHDRLNPKQEEDLTTKDTKQYKGKNIDPFKKSLVSQSPYPPSPHSFTPSPQSPSASSTPMAARPKKAATVCASLRVVCLMWAWLAQTPSTSTPSVARARFAKCWMGAASFAWPWAWCASRRRLNSSLMG